MSKAIGIDLGTSNSALAVSTASDVPAEIVGIPQLLAADSIGEATTLPSAIYLPQEGELAADLRLPWAPKAPVERVIGRWARERGAQVPERVVSSAKSWLCHPQVDRLAPLLPWKSDVAGKLSPVEASREILAFLKSAYGHAHGGDWDDARVVVTVPASFDEAARTLTLKAAEAAGLGKITLLEEPQAAFYAWIAQSGGSWRKQVKPGDIVLVVDVGGGTTDFSLISVSETEGNLQLERISVGEHLLLGGDNMDLALAYTLKAQLEEKGSKLDRWQTMRLVHGARLAKEALLSEDPPKEFPVAVAATGSSLFAKTVTTKLKRDQVLQLALDGFFPLIEVTEMPVQRRSVGIQELGLPFVADAAISKHLARFLTRSLEKVKSDPALRESLSAKHPLDSLEFLAPTAVLFNGGVFNAKPFRDRVMELVHRWTGTKDARELAGAEYDLAVAKGAAHYAQSLAEGKGIRIKAPTARAYYLGLQPSMPAVPGFEPPVKGLCVVPQGIEEGSELHLQGHEFGLVTGEPVEFRFFSSAVRGQDTVGDVVEDATHELEETSRLEITLPPVEGRTGEVIPVNLDAVVTEVGTLELYMKHGPSGKKWNLEFNVRPE